MPVCVAHAWPAVAIGQRLKITSAARKACVSAPWALCVRVTRAHLNATRVSGVRRACGTPRLSSKSSAARDVRCERRTGGVTARRGTAGWATHRRARRRTGRGRVCAATGPLRRRAAARRVSAEALGITAEKQRHFIFFSRHSHLKQVSIMELVVRGVAGASARRGRRTVAGRLSGQRASGRRLAEGKTPAKRRCTTPLKRAGRGRRAAPVARHAGRAPSRAAPEGMGSSPQGHAKTSPSPTVCHQAQGAECQEAPPRQGRKSRCFKRGTAARRVRPSTSCQSTPDSKNA